MFLFSFFVSANIQSTQNDILLYIGLTVAIFLVCLLSFFVIRLYRKKGQHQSLCNMAASGKLRKGQLKKLKTNNYYYVSAYFRLPSRIFS